MAKRAKRIVCFSLCGLVLCMNFLTVRAEALPDVMSGTSTLADNIMTYYALSGSAVANTDWINTLYNSYGSSFGTIEELANDGYLVLNDAGFWEPVEALGEMIEQAPAYSSLGLNEMFNVSAEEVAAGGGLAVASGGSILAGSLGGVASTGVVPLLGGVTAAYWGGIALGTLIAHGLGLYGDNIEDGTPIMNYDDLNQYFPSGSSHVVENTPYGLTGYYYEYGKMMGAYVGNKIYLFFNVGNSTSYKYVSPSGSVSNRVVQNNSQSVAYVDTGTSAPSFSIFPNLHFADLNAFISYISSIRNGTQQFPTPISPDMIGENGNLKSVPDGEGGYTIPDYKPQIDPGTQAGKPLTLQDWQNFANAVQNNNNSTSPVPDGNKGLFENILDLIRTVIPENVPNPNPNPNPDQDPYSPPVVTPVPDPTYPDPVPDQQITENPQESENPQQTEDPIDTGKPWRLPDLRNKFPFCIPWDIGKMFSKLKVNARQAPHISWRFNPPNTPIDYTFNLDLEDFEEAAALLRTLELIGFVVGLAFATRYLIGAN